MKSKRLRNLIMFIFCIFPLFLSMGFSSWTIIKDEELTVKPSIATPVAYIEGNRNVLYTSLEAAINVANNNSSNKNVIVIPGTTDGNGNTTPTIVNISKNLTIPNGVKVYIPFEETIGSNGSSTYKWETTDDEITSASSYADSSTTLINKNRKTLINLTNGADITIESGASLHLGGFCGKVGVVGAYTEINLDSGSKIDCSGTFYCYGYVKEKTQNNGNQAGNQEKYNNDYDYGRMIKVNSGATLQTPVAMFGQTDQSTLLNLNTAGVFPFNLFDFPNMQTYTEIFHGSHFVGQTYVMTTSSQMNYPVYQSLKVVDSSSALYNISGGSVAFEYCPEKTNVTTSNGITRVYVNGNIAQGYLSVNVANKDVTTLNKFFPVSYKLNLFINKGGIFSSSHQVKFLPGSLLKINSGGSVNISSEMIFYKGEEYNKIAGGYSVKTDAVLINNGILKVTSAGKIAAFIQTEATDNTAELNFLECTSSLAFTITSIENETKLEVSRTSEGLFSDNSEAGKSNYQFVAGSRVYSNSDGKMCWDGEKNDLVKLTITLAETIFEKKVFAYEIYTSEYEDGSNPSPRTSGSVSDVKDYELAIGSYVKIVVTRAASVVFKDGTNLDSSKWYLVSQDMELIFTPLEGVKLSLKTDGTSGNGSTSFTVLECSTNAGTFNEVATWVGIGGTVSTYVIRGWYFKVTYEDAVEGGTTVLDTDKFTMTSDNDSSNSKTFKANTAYLVDDQYTLYFPRKDGYSLPDICFDKGTLITLADGTQKAIENVTFNDSIMSFNHFTGNYESNKIGFIAKHEYGYYDIIKLRFSNGTELGLSGMHSMFNLTRKEYSNFTVDTAKEFVGDEFLMYDPIDSNYLEDGVKLVSVEIENKYTELYSIASLNNTNAITNGMLSNTPYFPNTFNIFELDDSLKYDPILMAEDINKYGLYEYEEFDEYISREVFDNFDIKYYKVAVGKGYMTHQDVVDLVKLFKRFVDDEIIILPS